MTDRIGETTSAARLLDAARAARAAGDLNAAAGLAREAAEAALAEADQTLEAEAATVGSGLLSATGDLAGAFAFADRALKLRQALNDPKRVASCLNNLGILYMRVGDYTQALECLKGAYDQLVECGEDPRRLTAIVNNIGIIYTRLGDYERAKISFTDGLETARQAGDGTFEVAALISLGDVQLRCGEVRQAIATLTEALEACEGPELDATRATALLNLGLAYQREGRLPDALGALSRALEASDEPDAQAEALLALSGAHAAAGQADEAVETATRALDLAAACDEKRLMSEAHERLAEQARAREDTEGALHHYMEFHRLDRELFNEQSERRAQILAVQFDVDRTRRQSETYRARMSIAQKARDAAEAEVRVRTKELEAAQIEVVTRLAMAAEYRDDDTGQHTWRVGRVAALLAEALGYPDEQVDLMRLASRLHDVGKIGTPDAILLKPGKLSVPEYRAMASHATIGARILSGGHSKLLRLA
ncbi:MAG TPA: tetratricopeptide repeat protein, partial [Deinococcales bacterium]|nr:tetratricopeptide repeat protein [Deinococcales bacterium]